MQCLSDWAPCASYAATDTLCDVCHKHYDAYHKQEMARRTAEAIILLKYLGYEIKEPPKRR